MEQINTYINNTIDYGFLMSFCSFFIKEQSKDIIKNIKKMRTIDDYNNIINDLNINYDFNNFSDIIDNENHIMTKLYKQIFNINTDKYPKRGTIEQKTVKIIDDFRCRLNDIKIYLQIYKKEKNIN
jgi:hypothetical protein